MAKKTAAEREVGEHFDRRHIWGYVEDRNEHCSKGFSSRGRRLVQLAGEGTFVEIDRGRNMKRSSAPGLKSCKTEDSFFSRFSRSSSFRHDGHGNGGNMIGAAGRGDVDLQQYEIDFIELEALERNSLPELKQLEGLDRWKPTKYERCYLPGLLLAGIPAKEQIILQNTADLHIHTQWSDGDDLDRILEQAVRVGLDAIAVTDHDEIDGAFEARRRVHERRLPLAVVPGTEVSTGEGHVGALFVMKTLPRGLGVAETVRLIHEAGGIAVAHHPYAPAWTGKLLGDKLGCGDLIKTVPFHAVECTNSVPGAGVRYNIAALEAIKKQHINIAVTGGSDAHAAAFVGKGRTYYGGNEGIVSLRHALLHGFTRGAEDYWKTREKIRYYARLLKTIAYRGIAGH